MWLWLIKIQTTDNANTAFPCNMAMQVAPHGGQNWNQCWLHYMLAKFLTNASGTLFFWRANSSFRCYTLRPLCLWQCFRLKGKISRPFHFSNVCSVAAIAISETIDDNEMLGDARHLKSGWLLILADFKSRDACASKKNACKPQCKERTATMF